MVLIDKNGKRKTNGSDSVTDVDVLRDRRNGNETKRNGNEPKQNERGNESNAKGDSTRNQSSLHYDSFAGILYTVNSYCTYMYNYATAYMCSTCCYCTHA